MDETSIKMWIEHGIQKAMHDAVPHACFMDEARLRVGNLKLMIPAMSIRFVLEVVMKPNKIVGKARLKFGDIRTTLFILQKFLPCEKQIRKRYTVVIIYKIFVHCEILP